VISPCDLNRHARSPCIQNGQIESGRIEPAEITYESTQLSVGIITGYAGTALEDTEIPPGMDLMPKPIALEALAARVGSQANISDFYRAMAELFGVEPCPRNR
jgi:hypothetical protein